MKYTEILTNIINVMEKNKDYLTELDRLIGDSDHGVVDKRFSKNKN